MLDNMHARGQDFQPPHSPTQKVHRSSGSCQHRRCSLLALVALTETGLGLPLGKALYFRLALPLGRLVTTGQLIAWDLLGHLKKGIKTRLHAKVEMLPTEHQARVQHSEHSTGH